jgi:intergrase/recombinase
LILLTIATVIKNQKWIEFNSVSASTLRKWNLNFMIERGIPESVSDFIQGRASVTVGSAHYLAKTNQADLWYSEILPRLIDILP